MSGRETKPSKQGLSRKWLRWLGLVVVPATALVFLGLWARSTTTEVRQQARGGGMAGVVHENQLGGPRLGRREHPQCLEVRGQTLGTVPYGHDHGQMDGGITHVHKDRASSTHRTERASFATRMSEPK